MDLNPKKHRIIKSDRERMHRHLKRTSNWETD
jgi:hypothetical protein